MKRYVCHFMSSFAGMMVLSSVLVVAYGADNAAANFSIGRDTFSISNAPGYCFAIASFSRWYYLTNPDGPPLREALDKKTQVQIAKELQQFYSKNLVTVQADYCNRYHGKQTESFQRFVMGLVVGDPRIVLLMNKSRRGAVLHAVLAYGWLPEQNLLKVYDPNYLNQERFINLDKREYTSLDITYNAICFPATLQDHPELLKKMEALYEKYSRRRAAAAQRPLQMNPDGYIKSH